ncbi:MAG TPA: hypothetical protein VMW63_00170 [Methanoregulaceae archaeon]|nr:hypothetical protein [Methanoregulaceae archaeon]
MILPQHRLILVIVILLACSITPAQALLYLQDVDITPAAPDLPSLTTLNATASIEIIPSGATTFSSSHTLILSTELDHARWDVQIFVDGIRGAVIPKDGNYVFVNGFLLSYPTSRDILVKIALEGVVPASPQGTPFIVMRVAELNNQNRIVTGSEQIVTRSIVQPELPQPLPLPNETVSWEETVMPGPTRAGIPVIAILGGLLIAVAILIARSHSHI